MPTRRGFLKQSALGAVAAAIPAGIGAMETVPPSASPEITWKRHVPVRYECDVAVVGGGIAGVSAALAAAQSGAKVLLIERFGVTGGNATVGGVGSFCGETAGQGEVFDATNTESLTAAEIRARRRMMQVLDYYQREEQKPWLLDHCASRIGIREGRRTVGEYVLTLDDLRAGRTFDDAIARGVFYLDGHRPDDDKRTYILPPEERQVPPYQIPYRALLPRGAKNLQVAGRCLSAEQLALSSARVMTTCAMMGQAAGIAAALAATHDENLQNLDFTEVRTIVEERGAKLTV